MNQRLKHTLTEFGLEALHPDSCVYVSKDGQLTVYVDELLIMGNQLYVSKMSSKLNKRFELEDLGPVNHLLGLRFTFKDNTGYLDQLHYIDNIWICATRASALQLMCL